MKKNRMRLIIPLWILSIVMACVTVNVYFPAKEVEKKAGDIVDEIRKKEPSPPTAPSGPQSSLGRLYTLIIQDGTAYAQKEAEVSSPAIQGLKNQIRGRFSRLIPFFQKGAIGEAKNGLVEIRDTGKLSAQEKNDLKPLVEVENRDRRALYQEVARSMNIPSDQIGKVQHIFAEKWQKSSDRGWWIQKEDGQWVQK
ncbi:MAG: YdbL family protein [Deltaproteobacteria bacterium]|nr:YdbL family protein [Deltaproteobacteria bacterium]